MIYDMDLPSVASHFKLESSNVIAGKVFTGMKFMMSKVGHAQTVFTLVVVT
jgi:hypothetical protein